MSNKTEELIAQRMKGLTVNERAASLWQDHTSKYFVTFDRENGEYNRPTSCFHDTEEDAIETITKATAARFKMDSIGQIDWAPGDGTHYQAIRLVSPDAPPGLRKDVLAFRVGRDGPFLLTLLSVELIEMLHLPIDSIPNILKQNDVYFGNHHIATSKALMGLVEYMKEKGI